MRSLYYRPEDLVATSLPSRARVLIFYWFTPNKSPTPSLFCRRTHWLSLHSLLTLTQRHSHCGTRDTNIKWHIHKHLYRHRHNWYIHRHWQKWCTQRHRHRDIHRLKASVSSWCKSHCTGGTQWPLAARTSLSLQRWLFFLFDMESFATFFLFSTATTTLVPPYLCSDECGATYTKTFWRKAEDTQFVCVNHLLFFYWSTLLRKPKPWVVFLKYEKINGLVEDILVVNSFCHSEQIIDNVCAQ